MNNRKTPAKKIAAEKHAARFCKKKTVHIEFPPQTHLNLRIKLMQRHNVSIQALFNEVAERIAADDPYMIRMLDKIIARREEEKLDGGPAREVSSNDAESLFDILEKESPFGE